MADDPGGLPDLKGKVSIDWDDLNTLLRKVDEVDRETSSKMRNVGESFRDAGAKMTAFTTLPIAAAMGYSVKAASDLGEAMNVTSITFKEARGEVDSFVKDASKIGQSERAAREATASFGGLLNNLGYTREESAKFSIELAKLSSDLGSAFNKEPAEAAIALGSALRGETEPIRAFNVMLDDQSVRSKAVAMGLAESTAEVDKHGKTQAAMALIMEQTKDVQGDFLRTQDGLANQSRILRAELENEAAALGEKLLPLALDATKGIGGLIDAFASLTDSQQYAIIGLAGFIAALGPTLTLVGNVSLVVNRLREAYAAMGAAALATRGALLVGAGGALIGLGYLIVDANAKYDKFKQSLEEKTDTSSLESLAAAYSATYEQASKTVKGWEEDTVYSFNTVKALWESGTVNRATEDLEKLKQQYDTLNAVYSNVATNTGLTMQQVEDLARAHGIDLTNGIYAAAEELTNYYNESQNTNAATRDLAASTQGLSDEVKSAEDRYKDFQDALDAVFGSFISAEEATLRVQEKTIALKEAYSEAGGKMQGTTEKSMALRQAMLDSLGAIESEVEALTRSGQISQDAAAQKQALISRLQTLQQQFPALRGEIQGYIDRINAVPDGQATTFTTPGLDEAQRKLDAFKKGLQILGPGPWSIEYAEKVGSQGHRATGGPTDPGKWYTGAERGNELFMSNTGGQVFNTETLQAMLAAPRDGGGQSLSFDITINANNASELRAAIPELVSRIRAGVR